MKQLLSTTLLGLAVFVGIAQAKQSDNLPGISAQSAKCFLGQNRRSDIQIPVSHSTGYFFTGKPYDADLGGFIFKYRNYDPELNRWTSLDPSGFPDGLNNNTYVKRPIGQFDPLGLTTVDSYSEAKTYWQRSNGTSSDTVTIGSSVISNIKKSSGFIDLIQRIQDNRIRVNMNEVDHESFDGFLPSRSGQTAGIGFVDLVVGRTSITYSDDSSWTSLSDWYEDANGVWGRNIGATTTMDITNNEVWDFEVHESDPAWVNFLEETLPGWWVGPGTPFNLTGSFSYEFETVGFQLE